jgi:tripeptide aminopeptidase
MSFDRLRDTLIEIIRLPSTSGHEEHVRAYLQTQLSELGLPTRIDSNGNLIATLNGEDGSALLLNAHMDRVPPGLGHEPVLRDGVLYSDGTTNLGADDAAGLAIILETIRRVIEQQLPHPPLVLVFTVEEEAGLCGARSFDSAAWQVNNGIVFDNAFEAGVVVSAGAAYEAFDITLSGRTGHPGKDLAQTIHAIEIFRAARYPHGSLNDDQTRINIGKISGGSSRNAIPATITIEGELRSFESLEQRQTYLQQIESAFTAAAHSLGGTAEVRFKTHSTGYQIDPNEPLLQTYRAVLAERGETLQLRPTFIGSDTSGFRPTIRAFTLSTGVVNEHSASEYVPLAPLEQLVRDTLKIFQHWQAHP